MFRALHLFTIFRLDYIADQLPYNSLYENLISRLHFE